MATRNVVLTNHQHQLVDSLVKSGRYQNASEVLREGLRLLERREEEDASRLSALRSATARGWDDLAAGRYEDIADDGLEDYIGRLGIDGTRSTSSS